MPAEGAKQQLKSLFNIAQVTFKSKFFLNL